MRKQDYLVALIQSLNANEKRYFKLQNKLQPGNKKYNNLFDELGKATKYDAAGLVKTLKKTTTQLSSEKEYLEKILMRSLRTFNEDLSLRTELNNALIEIEVLYNKQQYKTVISKVEKWLKTAIDNELFDHATQLIRWHHMTYQFVGPKVISNEMIALERKVLSLLSNEAEYRHLFYEFGMLIMEHEHMPGKKAEERCREMLQNPLIQNEELAISVKARLSLYRVCADYYSRIALDNLKAEHYLEKGMDMLEKNPVMLKSQLRGYLYLMQALISSYTTTGQHKQAEAVIKKNESLVENKTISLAPALKRELKTMIVFDRVALLISCKNYKALLQYCNEVHIQKYFEEFTPSHSYVLRFWVAFGYLINNMPDKALALSSAMLTDYPVDAKSFMHSNYHLYLMTQYDLGNYTIMANMLQSYTRWCSKNNLNDAVFKKFAAMLRALIKATNKTEKAEVAREYMAIFEQLTDSPGKVILFGNFDLLSWLKTKA